MYLRRHRRTDKGTTYEYWTLVESRRTACGPRQHTVATLGKLPGLDESVHAGWEAIDDLLLGRPSAKQLPLSGKAHKQLRRKASKQGSELQPETLIYAEYVMVLTTFPEKEFPARLVLEWYRFRWQIELIFKRFKQIAQLGHLPKQDPESAKAWLYGKLFVALLTDKVLAQARALSPWGYSLQAIEAP